MTKKYYFIAGLPRSGSTLLSSILDQNPKFYAGPASPVLNIMQNLEQHFAKDLFFLAYPKPKQAEEVISNIIHNFYNDVEIPIIVDKNRGWAANVSYIEYYIGQKAKIICPVRNINEILTSLISMIHRNPYREGIGSINFLDKELIKLNIPLFDDNRCDFFASSRGCLGRSLISITEAFRQGFGDRLYFVEYKDLVNKPQKTLNGIYEFIEEHPFEHTFDSIENTKREDDINIYSIPDMHQVRPKLELKSPNPSEILSQYILEKYKNMNIWRDLETIKNWEPYE
jgi:sulfotransferase